MVVPCLALAQGQFVVRSFPSRTLGREESFAVWNPAGRGQPEFAILFLHGAGRDHLTLWNQPRARAAIEASSAAIVFSHGGKSWWVNSSETKAEDYLLELMQMIGAKRWAAAGWSMGGYGSLRLVSRYPERFTAWGGLLALADFPNPAYPKEQNHSVPMLFGKPDGWAQWNPLPDVAKLRSKRIWFLTGTRAFDRSMNEALDRRLRELGIPHEFHVVEGGHELRLVVENLAPLLRFLEKSEKTQ